MYDFPLLVCCLFGFNRYMVECESTFLLLSLMLYRVLIDTWWNVNHELVQSVALRCC